MQGARIPTTVPPALRLLPFLIPLYASAVVGISLLGQITPFQTAAALVIPPAAWILSARPAWFVCGLLAIPPGVIALVPFGRPELLMGLVLAGVAFRFLTNRGAALPYVLLPFALLLFLAATMQADVGDVGSQVGGRLLRLFGFYLVLGVMAFSLARTRELSVLMVAGSVMVGILGTIVLLFFQTSSPASLLLSSGSAPSDPGLLGYRTHFGYLMAVGWAFSLPRAVRAGSGSHNGLWWALALTTAVMAGLSFTRGAWGSILLVAAFVLFVNRRVIALIVAITAVSVLLTVPTVSERLTGGAGKEALTAVGIADFTTGRSELWEALGSRAAMGFPGGHGWGYTWSLTASQLLGPARTFGDGAFLYPHNDFLFWSLELGILGLALFLMFWLAFVATTSRARKSMPSWEWQTVVGVGISMFIASMVDNGIFIRAVSEPFFVIAGLASAAAVVADR